MKTYMHYIVTTEGRDFTGTTETVYSASNKPINSMKMYLQFMKGVQYEIYNRKTNEVEIVGSC